MTSGALPDTLFSKGIPEDEEVMTLEDALKGPLAAVELPPETEEDGSFCLEVCCEEPLEWAREAGLSGQREWHEERGLPQWLSHIVSVTQTQPGEPLPPTTGIACGFLSAIKFAPSSPRGERVIKDGEELLRST